MAFDGRPPRRGRRGASPREGPELDDEPTPGASVDETQLRHRPREGAPLPPPPGVSPDAMPPSIPKLPAAFVGRRRFSARLPDPAPLIPEDPIARARQWQAEPTEEPAVPEAEAPPAEPVWVVRDEVAADEEPSWIVHEEPRPEPSWLQSIGPDETRLGTQELLEPSQSDPYVSLDEVPPDQVTPKAGGLPRLRVAGVQPLAAGLELPSPSRVGDWPTETPPAAPSLYARGADESFHPADVPPPPPQRAPARPPKPQPRRPKTQPPRVPTRDEELGHTLQPRSDPPADIGGWPTPPEPPPPPPRPSLDDLARYPVRHRPEGPSLAPKTSLTQQPVPSPFRQPREPTADPDAPARGEEQAEDAIATMIWEPEPEVDLSVSEPIDFEPFPEEDVLYEETQVSMRPRRSAAMGCVMAFIGLGAIGAIGVAAYFTWG